jgi:hypothetical protein
MKSKPEKKDDDNIFLEEDENKKIDFLISTVNKRETTPAFLFFDISYL